ncbi:MAG: NAD(P)/FAD-dependent oxidoreductase [Cyanophyceae cyanobacterium]
MKAIVIGGGAAGFFGAIACAATHPPVSVTLLEAGRKPLAKVRLSGGGRCNVTHHCFDPAQLVQYYPRGGKALRGAFTRFQPQDTAAWFESRGVQLKTEADGRMFPTTDSSATIVNCLVNAAVEAGVELRLGAAVKSVCSHGGSFVVQLKSGETLGSDRLLLATGSNPLGYRWAKELGHSVVPPVPSLFTFNIDDPRLKELAGVSVDNVNVRLVGTKLAQSGPLLITHWGISGPAVLKLSAWGARILHNHCYRMPVAINWVPGYSAESLRHQLLNIKAQTPRKRVQSYCPLPLPKRLWQQFVDSVGITQTWAEVSKKQLNRLVDELTQGSYQIDGKGVFKEEFVTCGGVKLKEVDFKTMASKCCPGLHLAGEILDVDGVTGGFNFQSAWTTSWLAGRAMGNRLS